MLGSLMEKEVTTPENYPLSMNALVNACNQKSSREPVMELSEEDVRGALFELEEKSLVRRIDDARVAKFENRTRDGLNLRRDEFAVVCLLLLRGPQTVAELRARAERLHQFEENADVHVTLERLAAREEAIVVLLPRQPGAREARWMHRLCGAVEAAVESAAEPRIQESRAGAPGLEARIDDLEARVRILEERLGFHGVESKE